MAASHYLGWFYSLHPQMDIFWDHFERDAVIVQVAGLPICFRFLLILCTFAP